MKKLLVLLLLASTAIAKEAPSIKELRDLADEAAPKLQKLTDLVLATSKFNKEQLGELQEIVTECDSIIKKLPQAASNSNVQDELTLRTATIMVRTKPLLAQLKNSANRTCLESFRLVQATCELIPYLIYLTALLEKHENHYSKEELRTFIGDIASGSHFIVASTIEEQLNKK